MDESGNSAEEIRQRRLNKLLSQTSQSQQPSLVPVISSSDIQTTSVIESNVTHDEHKTIADEKLKKSQPESESLSMDTKEPERVENMDVDESSNDQQQNIKRKLIIQDLVPKKIETNEQTSTKSFNVLNIIERIFQINLESSLDNKFMRVNVTQAFLNYEVYYKELIEEIISNVLYNFNEQSVSNVLNDKSMAFLLDSFKRLNINFNIQSIALKYLIDSFNRIKNSKLSVRESKELVDKIILESKTQIIRYTIHVLGGCFLSEKFSYSLTQSQLTPFLFVNYSSDFIYELIIESLNKTSNVYLTNGSNHSIQIIFAPVLNHLSNLMNSNSLSLNENEYMTPFYVFRELCDIKVEQTNPICNLMVEMSNWIPNSGDTEWENNGKILAETSLLGPYFKLSIFAEEDTKVADRYYKRDNDTEISPETLTLLTKQMHPLMYSTRSELHKIVKILVYNKQSREPMINFLKYILNYNIKRSNIQINESTVCGDGYMLNVLYILQELSRPIKKEKVDLMAIFDAKTSPILLREDESKLNCTKESFVEWINSLNKESFEKPSFNTDIFFLTIYAHHISVISIITKYMRRVRVIKELNKYVDELKKSENNWKMTPLANRYRNAIRRFQTKVKISQSKTEH